MDRTTAEALAPAPLKEREVRSIILGIMLAMLLAALEQTIVATALPTIGRDLGDLTSCPGSPPPISSPRRRRRRSTASSPRVHA